MSDNKKLVIKINYANKPHEFSEAETNNIAVITEWNIKRIAATLAVLFLSTGVVVYLWIKSGDLDNKSTPLPVLPNDSIASVAQSNKMLKDETRSQNEVMPLTIMSSVERPEDSPTTVMQPNTDAANGDDVNNNAQHIAGESKARGSVPSGKVVRGSLAKSIRHKEPYGTISLPLMLGKHDERTIYYFTELKDMSGKQIYHEWLYKGKSVFKRPIKIAEQSWRTSTHKIIRSNALGDWSVRAIDAQGEIMHQIDFSVVAKK